MALARALEGATAAGRWDVVAQIADELKARRLAQDGIRTIGATGRGRRAP
jgi:hypothetical protein